MKKHDRVYLFLSILEGMLSGGYLYLARRDRRPANLFIGIVWMICSVGHGLLGTGNMEVEFLDSEDFDYE